VAKVAMSHGINANNLYGWRKLARRAEPAIVQREFAPVAVAPAAQVHSDERGIELELRRGAVTAATHLILIAMEEHPKALVAKAPSWLPIHS